MNRTVAPPYSQAEDLKLIFPEKIELNNGSVLYWMKDVKDDSVKMDIQWSAGSKYQEKKLLASFTNRMLLSGSGDVNSRQIAEEIDFFGGYTELEVDRDHGGVVIYGLVENFESIFGVFQKAYSIADFPTAELEKERDISLNKFKIESQKVKVLCRRAFGQNLFGKDSGYGEVAEEEDFANLLQSDLQAYFLDKYQKAPVIFLTGNVSNGFIEQLKSWTSDLKPVDHVPKQQQFTQLKGRLNIEKSDAIQSAIRIGRLMFDKNHKDYFRFQILSTILGGYFGSRLMANIREDKGYTYGIGSGVAVLQDEGYFFITTEVGADVKESAIAEIFKELDKLKAELVEEDELTKVKNYMLGEFLRQADGSIALMEIFKNIYFNELPTSYYSDFIHAIHAATAEELQDLAVKYFDRAELLEVVAG